jgi:hypothetical protein
LFYKLELTNIPPLAYKRSYVSDHLISGQFLAENPNIKFLIIPNVCFKLKIGCKWIGFYITSLISLHSICYDLSIDFILYSTFSSC